MLSLAPPGVGVANPLKHVVVPTLLEIELSDSDEMDKVLYEVFDVVEGMIASVDVDARQ